jgi:hypothetical protein
MGFMISVVGYIRMYRGKRNIDIRREQNIFNLGGKVKEF